MCVLSAQLWPSLATENGWPASGSCEARSTPFTSTGVDYFGPIVVKRGRSLVKRYGVLFTCLASRAVHLEMAASLDTDAFINALRRFVARRGQVRVMRSDNGTNLVGGERELREAIQDWNTYRIETFLQQKNITWLFNAPGASHHGGSWERLIRSSRRIMVGLLKEQTLSDDGLATLLAEVEAILNGRPLTRCSSDPKRFVLFDSEPSSSTQVWSGSSSWHLYWKRQLRSSSLEASAILERSVLEKMGSWVLGVTSRTSEMVFPFAQCAGGRRCSRGWFQCSERFLGSWSSHRGVSWQEWSGQECVHQNEVFHVGASNCEVGYGSWMWWIKCCYVFWLCITMTCTIWCTKNIDECYVKSVCGNWLVSVRGRYVSAVYGVISWGTTIRLWRAV